MTDAQKVLENTIERCRERDIIIPTYEEMAHPEKVPKGIKKELGNIGLWDLHSRNLFRITWKNNPVEFGGGFGGANCLEIPPELSGVRARILILIGGTAVFGGVLPVEMLMECHKGYSSRSPIHRITRAVLPFLVLVSMPATIWGNGPTRSS